MSGNFSKDDLERKITLKAGDKAPDFSAKNADEVSINLSDFVGKKVILYFYPKDMTPGCTKEACEFSEFYADFKEKNTIIIGISPDSPSTHEKFLAKHDLKHILLSDENHEISKLYGVWQVKKNYGKEYLGIVRTTFVIDEKGDILKVYKSVKVAGHASRVLAELS